MISLARSAIGFKSAYSGLTTSKYLPSGDHAVGWRHIVLGNIDAPRIGRIVDVAELLQRDLPTPRQEPIDKNLGRVGVRRLIQKLSEPPPEEKLDPSFHRVVSKSSTGSPWFLARMESLQPKQIA